MKKKKREEEGAQTMSLFFLCGGNLQKTHSNAYNKLCL